jgi:hypothetical protein
MANESPKEKLHIITSISNPMHFKSRAERYRRFEKEIHAQGGNLITVEAACGTDPHEVTQANNPKHVQLRTNDVLWHKENMINIGVSRLPPDWEYVAWVDADLTFLNENWIEDTIERLQQYDVVQCWETACDLGPSGEIFLLAESFMSCWAKRKPYRSNSGQTSYPYWHAGYAWACRRSAFETLGGLIERSILGAADHHMANCLIGTANMSLPRDVHPNMKKLVEDWEAKASSLSKNMSFVPGTVAHHWHGKKADRKYRERWSILIDHQFDPMVDIEPDAQGLLKFTPAGERLRKDVRDYFQQRNEDSIDL